METMNNKETSTYEIAYNIEETWTVSYTDQEGNLQEIKHSSKEDAEAEAAGLAETSEYVQVTGPETAHAWTVCTLADHITQVYGIHYQDALCIIQDSESRLGWWDEYRAALADSQEKYLTAEEVATIMATVKEIVEDRDARHAEAMEKWPIESAEDIERWFSDLLAQT